MTDRVALVRNLALNLIMIQTRGFTNSLDGAAWSVSAEWAAYLAPPLLLVSSLRGPPRYAWLTAGTCMAFVAMLPALSDFADDRTEAHAPLDIFRPNLALPVMRCLAEFTLGLIAYRIARSSVGAAMSQSCWKAPVVVAVTLVMLTVAECVAIAHVHCQTAHDEGRLDCHGMRIKAGNFRK